MGIGRFFIDIYIGILVIDCIISYIPQIKNHQFAHVIKKMADWTCRPIRRHLPAHLPLDFSPIIVILALKFFEVIY